jgi:hypothetical protein
LFLANALALAAAVGCGVSSRNDPAREPDGGESSAATVFDGFQIDVFDDAKRSLAIMAEQCAVAEDESRANLEAVQIVQYDDKGREFGWVTADSGVYFIKEAPKENKFLKDLLLAGNVRLRRADGFTLQTQRATFRTLTREFSSPTFTTFHLPLNETQMLKGLSPGGFGMKMVGEEEDVSFHLRGSKEKRAHVSSVPRPKAPKAPNARGASKKVASTAAATSSPRREEIRQ